MQFFLQRLVDIFGQGIVDSYFNKIVLLLPGDGFAICSYGHDLYLSGGERSPRNLTMFENEKNEWRILPGVTVMASVF